MSRGWVAPLLALALTAGPALAETRRMAIIAGNNAGSGDMPPLRFAEADAGKMARVLVELGDVLPDDVLLLQGRPVRDLEAAIAEARARVAHYKAQPDTRTVLVFYFSGHSDGEAIELGRERLAYQRLKAMLTGTGADVRVTIVDACKSGAGIREKGGKPAETFVIKLADTLNATGEAFITSSAANEAALESNEVSGSYFTHNFISGLRGAADVSGDKLVTLAEAYRYAYERTVSATAVLPVGAQHPSYDYRLSGQGELVLASLLRPSATLVMPQAERALVTDVARDQVVVELTQGPAREVALSPGRYAIRLFKDGQSFSGRISLAEGARHTVQWSELQAVSGGVMVARKGGESHVAAQAQPVEARAIGLAMSAGITGRLLLPAGVTDAAPKYQLRLVLEPTRQTLGRFTLFGNPRLGQVEVLAEPTVMLLGELSLDSATPGFNEPANEGGGQLRLGYRLGLRAGRVMLGLGVEAGGGFLMQLYGVRTASAALVLAPRATLRVQLFDFLALAVDADVTALGVQFRDAQGEGFRFFPFPSLTAGLVASF